MKRILSWIVLYLLSIVVSLLTSFVVGIGGYLLGLVSDLNTFLQIIAYIFGGSAFLGLILSPAFYGSGLVIAATENIAPSKKGTRYIVFSIYMLIVNIVYILMELYKHSFPIHTIIMCIYYVSLLILGKDVVKENTGFEDD